MLKNSNLVFMTKLKKNVRINCNDAKIQNNV